MFSKEQLEQYQRDGFIVVPNFFDADEVQVLQDEIERFKAEGLLRNVATEGDGKTTSSTKRNLQLCPTHPHSPAYRALPYSAKVAEAVRELVGDPVRIKLDQVFLKPAKDGAGTSWHQDNAYFLVEDATKGVGMWIAVHDAHVANGTMHMMPGLQRERLEHVRDGGSDHHIRCYVDESQEVPCEMAAGGVVFFMFGTPHCTKGNSTDRDRAGLAYHFFNANHPPQDKYEDVMPYLTGPDAKGGADELGEDQRGKWEQIVAEHNRQPVAF